MWFIASLLLVLLNGQTEAAQCACATTGLNVRSAAGTSHGILHVMETGDCATYLGQSSQADGYTWLHLSVAGQMRLIVALLLVHLYGQTEAAQCACSTGSLNVRSGAGTSHAIVHVMQTGECATYLGQSSQAEDLTWLHVTVAGQTGWAASNWLNVEECKTSQCACSTGSLNVRSGAGTSHAIVHVMQTGECATYLGQSSQAEDLTWLHLTVAGQVTLGDTGTRYIPGGRRPTGCTLELAVSVRLSFLDPIAPQAYSGNNGPCRKEGEQTSFMITGDEHKHKSGTSTGTNTGTSSVQLPGCPHIVTRAEWGARAPKSHIGNMAALPIYVFVHHGDGSECFDRASCWPDIGYNFVVGEDGNAYEARGCGGVTSECGLANGKINPNYTLKGHRDVGDTDCPGTALYNLIHTWPHYASGTALYG
ncbi:hypothetical protein C0Q70_08649 [Pomacea canaliculata]|uniref:SH3b domain-containing protein n=1 Tax=Pomacea canaliculata TaxID=400727 RepID=A0A2T7P7J9_POMCA|nr:hypothetical protein C0Q70_08649 [Pomacea canaliculata]